MQSEMIGLNVLQKIDPFAVGPLARDPTLTFRLKRTLDICVAVVVLILLFVPMAIIAALIALDSPGPAIFVQERVGGKRSMHKGYSYWKRTTFRCYKFRTMVHNADPALHQKFVEAYIANDQKQMDQIQGGSSQVKKLVNDPRITRIGRFLRKTSLDELPQFWNVLKGEMSVVGPRPPIPYELELYQPWHFERLKATPGITGLWQIKGRSSAEFDTMVRLDIDYIDHRSLLMDLVIIGLTPLAVISCKGAS